jgi:anhydro-N-acetylmuramic acid kinase
MKTKTSDPVYASDRRAFCYCGTDGTTVADFRPRDIAAGGHGALDALPARILFHHPQPCPACGEYRGISNVTYLPAIKSAGAAEVLA